MKAVDAAMDEIEAEQQDVTAETSPEPDRNNPLPCPIEQRRADVLGRLSDAFLSGDQGTVSGGGASAETFVPDCDGEPTDDDLVVQALFQMDSGTMR